MKFKYLLKLELFRIFPKSESQRAARGWNILTALNRAESGIPYILVTIRMLGKAQ